LIFDLNTLQISDNESLKNSVEIPDFIKPWNYLL